MTGSLINQLVTAFATIAGGTGFWGFIQWARERKGLKAQAAKDQQAQEKAAQQAEIDRAKLLADAQAVAQTTALDSANEAYRSVRAQCTECLTALAATRQATEKLIDAIEALIEQPNGIPERQNARLAVREYRAL